MESVIATHPQKVGSDVCDQSSDIIVATVEHTVVFGEGREPLVVGDVVAQHAQAFRTDVGGVAHDLHHGVASLGVLAPVLIMLEIGFRDETYTRSGATVDVGVVVAHTVGGPVGHAVVDVLAVVDTHGGDAVLADTDVGTSVEAATADAAFNREVEELLRACLPR